MAARIGILGMVGLVALCPPAQASPLEQAAANIDRYRKGDAIVRVQRPDGSPVAGAGVSVRQTTHDFLFGNYIRPRHYEDPRYLERFRELFNFVELLEFNWGQYEPDEGKPLMEERMRLIHGWCRRNGLTSFYGHMLVWTSQYGQYPKTCLPLWLFKYDKAAQYGLLRKRIGREVTAYRDVDIMWDVVNEAVHCRVWGDWNQQPYVQNKRPEPMDRIVPYVRDALTWAHEANPDARLLINDYRVIVRGQFRERYKKLIDTLLEQKVPISAVGIQAHDPYKGKYWYTPEELWATYELFGTQTGLPIYITEFFYVSDDTQDIQGGRRKGKWSEPLQADAIEEFYRVTFAHPSVKAIVYFGLTDSEVVQPKCGLLGENYHAKPAWNRLRRLIRDEWTTEESGTTSKAGEYRFRGFFGQYSVKVSDGGKQHEFRTHLEQGKENSWVLTLGRQAERRDSR